MTERDQLEVLLPILDGMIDTPCPTPTQWRAIGEKVRELKAALAQRTESDRIEQEYVHENDPHWQQRTEQEPVAWPHRVYSCELGYIVWRDVFEGNMRCSLDDAARAHKVAVFVTESEADDYCRFRNYAAPALDDEGMRLLREARDSVFNEANELQTLYRGYPKLERRWKPQSELLAAIDAYLAKHNKGE